MQAIIFQYFVISRGTWRCWLASVKLLFHINCMVINVHTFSILYSSPLFTHHSLWRCCLFKSNLQLFTGCAQHEKRSHEDVVKWNNMRHCWDVVLVISEMNWSWKAQNKHELFIVRDSDSQPVCHERLFRRGLTLFEAVVTSIQFEISQSQDFAATSFSTLSRDTGVEFFLSRARSGAVTVCAKASTTKPWSKPFYLLPYPGRKEIETPSNRH